MSIYIGSRKVAGLGGGGASADVQEQITALEASKQDRLAGQPGQVVGFAADGSAAAVQGWSNTNFLDNSYWAARDAIINLRGKTEYVTTYTFSINRWLGNRLLVKLADNWLSLTRNSSEGVDGYFAQTIDTIVDAGEVLTFSALVDNELFSISAAFKEDMNAGSAERNGVKIWIRENESRPQAVIQCLDVGVEHLATAAKLEPGDHQTMVHKEGDTWVLNDPPPNTALELLKCQRYYRRLEAVKVRAAYYGSNSFYFPIDYGEMRAVPAITLNGAQVRTYFANAATEGFTFTVASKGLQTALIGASKTNHGMTDAYMLADSIILDSEL